MCARFTQNIFGNDPVQPLKETFSQNVEICRCFSVLSLCGGHLNPSHSLAQIINNLLSCAKGMSRDRCVRNQSIPPLHGYRSASVSSTVLYDKHVRTSPAYTYKKSVCMRSGWPP